jgi:hypothetical protein
MSENALPYIVINDSEDRIIPVHGVLYNESLPIRSLHSVGISAQINRAGEIISGDIPAGRNISISSFSPGDQFVFDSVLNNNFDVTSTNILFEKIKNYEVKYKEPSNNFYKKWSQGQVVTTPEIYNWMSTYKTLFL